MVARCSVWGAATPLWPTSGVAGEGTDRRCGNRTPGDRHTITGSVGGLRPLLRYVRRSNRPAEDQAVFSAVAAGNDRLVAEVLPQLR
jgi:hypothetical protein